ncbi:MAG: hypothetical protein WAU77_10055 [Solirubrobacteraceae bacterium]
MGTLDDPRDRLSDQPQGSPAAVLDVETLLTQSYRIDSPVSAGATVQAIRNGSGNVELFTLGTGGEIWNFYPDPASASGYAGVPTGVHATTFAAALDRDGRIVLFAALGLALSYAVEAPLRTTRWSQPIALRYPTRPHASGIAKILTAQIAGRLYVGLLIEFSSLGQALYSFAYSLWDEADPRFEQTHMDVDSTNCVWLGQSAQSAAFACVDTTIVAYWIATGEPVHYPMVETFSTISVDATTDTAGNTALFAVHADGNPYRLIGGAENRPYEWEQLSSGGTLRQIRAETDTGGKIDVFAVSANNRLYHWQPDTTRASGFDEPFAIATGVASVSLAADDEGQIDAFAIGVAQSTLTHLVQEQPSSEWTAQTVEVPSVGDVEEYVAYTSDVAVYDAAGAPLGEQAVTISASAKTRVAINGQVFFVGPNRPARVSTDGAGLLSIVQETGAFASRVLGVNVTGVMAADQLLTLEPAQVVHQDLAAISGQRLLEDRTVDGDYLLAERYRTAEATDKLAAALRQCMQLASRPDSQVRPLPGLRCSNVGVGVLQYRSLEALETAPPAANTGDWRLAFGEQLEFELLVPGLGAVRLAEQRASLPGAEGPLDLLEDIGDFFAGVVDGAIEVLEVGIHTVAGAVVAAVEYTIDGVKYLYETVIDAIGKALDLAELCVAAVGVGFERAFRWLGFIFQWDDIVRTHEALAYTLDQFLGFLVGAIGGTQRLIDDGIEAVKDDVAKIFDEAVAAIDGEPSLGSFQRDNQTPVGAVLAANANNPFYTGVLQGAPGAHSALEAVFEDGLAGTDSLMSQLTAFADGISGSHAFSEAERYMDKLGEGPDELFSQSLKALLRLAEGVVELILTEVQAVIDAVLQALQTIVAGLRTALGAKWEVPFVSSLYSKVAGGAELSMLDLIAMMIAIPTTVLYKATKGESPFASAASIAAFKASFDSQSMLRAVGFAPSEHSEPARVEQPAEPSAAQPAGPTLPQASPAAPGALQERSGSELALQGFPSQSLPLSNTMQQVLQIGAGFTQVCCGVVTAFVDSSATPSPRLSRAALSLQCLEMALQFPGFYSQVPIACTSPEGRQSMLWIYEIVGVGLDAYFVFSEGSLTEAAEDKGTVIAFAYAVGQSVMTGVACPGQEEEQIAGNILSAVPGLAVPLRLSSVASASEGFSLPALGVIGGVYNALAGGLTIYIAVKELIDPEEARREQLPQPTRATGAAMNDPNIDRQASEQRRPRGPRPLPKPKLPRLGADFSGVYLRPNLSSGPVVPMSPPYCDCPDIWLAGTGAIDDFQKVLATSSSYAVESGQDIAEGRDNYIYVRAGNSSGVAQSRTVQLYNAPSSVIQWPDRWESNVILTDREEPTANISNLAPYQVGVADRPFVWKNVQPPPRGSNHYCLIAQLNDASNYNPPPDIQTLLDMAALVRSNPGFGWKNTRLVPRAEAAFEFTENITIAHNMPPGQRYTISVSPTGWVGFSVEITCSEVDADKKQIGLMPTEIVQDGETLGAPECKLDPGFEGSINVIVTNPKKKPYPQAATIPLSCHYTPGAHTAEAKELVRRGLVDWDFVHNLHRHWRSRGLVGRIEPTPLAALGSFHWKIQ